MEILSQLSLIHWIIGVAIYLIVTGAIAYGFVCWFFRRQWQLYRNLKRPIVLLTPIDSQGRRIDGTEMNEELRLLRSNQFLNVTPETTDYRSYDPSGTHSIVVLGYHQNMHGLKDLLGRIKTHHVPLLVYTYGKNIGVIKDEHKHLLDEYPYTLIANFKMTLMNHIFATVASFPYSK
jgi:uncharacterized SAM-binding protein YcdF (DUF218 family)